uniref:ATP synthase complex subunit 8 n=1 Tax=Acrocrypta assamensis TaxID=715818 RepID=A0A411DA03_9CUCU|nr:ATP synthase F0 subunit 8 [Acrocrypta assamensis]
MPQMMPLNWLLLMIFFILIFYLLNNLNYFNLIYSNYNTNFNIKKYTNNWKW